MSDFAIQDRVLLANIVGFLDGSILPVLAVPGKPVEPGLFQAGLAGFADEGVPAGSSAGRAFRTPAATQADGAAAVAAARGAVYSRQSVGCCPTLSVRSRRSTVGSCASSQPTNWRKETSRTSG